MSSALFPTDVGKIASVNRGFTFHNGKSLSSTFSGICNLIMSYLVILKTFLPLRQKKLFYRVYVLREEQHLQHIDCYRKRIGVKYLIIL